METKDFLRGILKKDSMPQVLNFQGGVLVPTVAVDANQVASYIDGLSKYERMLLKLRISRHSRDASYLARHVALAVQISKSVSCLMSFGRNF